MGANYTRKSRVRCVTGYATKAQANAGKKILPPEAGRSYIVVGGWIRTIGAKTNECTTVDICSTAGTPVVNVAVAKAALGSANALASFDHASNITRTTYGNDNVAGGMQILTVGTDESTATGFDYCVEFLTTGA